MNCFFSLVILLDLGLHCCVVHCLILEEPEVGLVFLELGMREFDLGEKPQFMNL